MKNKKHALSRISVGLLAAVLLVGSLSLDCFADTEETKSFEELVKEVEANMPKEIPKVEINVTTEVPEDAETFNQPVVYQTFNESDDPKWHIQDTVEVNGVKYKVVEVSEPKRLSSEDNTPVGVTRITEPFLDPEDPVNDPEEYVTYDGVQVKLNKKELKTLEPDSVPEYRTKTVVYRDIEDGQSAPATQTIEFEDRDTGITFDAELDLISSEVTETRWSDEFVFPIAITNYGADEYDLNGTIVKKDEPLIDHASTFLALLGLNPEYYEINKIEWAGEPYTNADGVVCRNAAASGRKKIQTIKATYGGDVQKPSIPTYAWECEYIVEMEPELAVVYTMVADVKLEKVKDPEIEIEGGTQDEAPDTIWEKIKGFISAVYEGTKEFVEEYPAVSVSILVVLAGLIVFLLVLRAKNRCIYNKKIKCPYRKHDENTCANCIHYYKANQKS